MGIAARLENFAVRFLSTFFYLGDLPLVPGTFGSLGGVVIFLCINGHRGSLYLVTLLIIFLGFLVSGRAEKLFQKKDAKIIVIDEVSGMLLSFFFLPFYNTQVIIIAFLIFRILDTLKVFPAQRLQDISGSLGVMSDDIIAAFYTNIILQVVLRLASFKAS